MSKLVVLFVSRNNSIRSQIAESQLKKQAGDKFEVYSAGIQTTDGVGVHPVAKMILEMDQSPTDGLEAKTLDQFLNGPGKGKTIDFVFTLSDTAHSGLDKTPLNLPPESILSHWRVEEPDTSGDEEVVKQNVFRVLNLIALRIELLVSLPFESLEQQALQYRLDEIGGAKKTLA